ncbi:DUF4142 domain-containing protein [Agrobacterium rhizogenes]|nr:DUF4142 domain-containing protein [Rhizobium rhizogenes]NTH62115.1 DUF4142 domain-containing protein [Rhizobium rhizogenes]NTH93741.1 DUF4142 domain-containing protein [Rhizobium rhizogenes]
MLERCDQGDNAEISPGRLAVQKGASAGVRSVEQTLVDDHSQNKKDAAALALDLDVKATDGVGQEAQGEIDRVRRLTSPVSTGRLSAT